MEHRLWLLQSSGRKAGRAGWARLELDQNSEKFGSSHPSTFCSKVYIPSTINTWLMLWERKLVSRALAYFDQIKLEQLRTETYSNTTTTQKQNTTRFIWVFIVLCMYITLFCSRSKTTSNQQRVKQNIDCLATSVVDLAVLQCFTYVLCPSMLCFAPLSSLTQYGEGQYD
jgi:hypothetical protein